jgi:stearoyl-CoA desaturase (Delta-9 desaturase)
MFSGIFDLPWWGYVLYTLAVTHITIVGVTVFLHRYQAHRSLDLNPVPSHFFRLWLWLTTGMVTREWAAIHRKHHAKCETIDDPHSPQVKGINKVLWEGAELYQEESRNRETVEKYGHGTPDDWLERHLYGVHPNYGVTVMLFINLALFGVIGLTIWAVQMIWIPFFAAGVINGMGHYWGYRNFQPEDASTNISPFGILIGGEELHNNHHAYPSSAKLSSRWYEFDIGWMYIRLLEWVRLARVKKVAPKLRFAPAKEQCDNETLQAVLTHRYDVLARYVRSMKQAYRDERRNLQQIASDERLSRGTLKRWMLADPGTLTLVERTQFQQVLARSKVLETAYSLRLDLCAIWARSSASREQLVTQLEDWCQRAESSNIQAVRDFSRKLRSYA